MRPDLATAFGRVPPLVDEDAELAKATFPIPPDSLIGLTKAWLASQVEDDGMDWFADDFRFVAPVVGPFDKGEFVDSLKGFDLPSAFPDLAANPHHFRVCPFEPNRVWWSVKYVGKNTGPIFGGPATMKSVESPVQAQSATFNERGEITKFTIGYVLDKVLVPRPSFSLRRLILRRRRRDIRPRRRRATPAAWAVSSAFCTPSGGACPSPRRSPGRLLPSTAPAWGSTSRFRTSSRRTQRSRRASSQPSRRSASKSLLCVSNSSKLRT